MDQRLRRHTSYLERLDMAIAIIMDHQFRLARRRGATGTSGRSQNADIHSAEAQARRLLNIIRQRLIPTILWAYNRAQNHGQEQEFLRNLSASLTHDRSMSQRRQEDIEGNDLNPGIRERVCSIASEMCEKAQQGVLELENLSSWLHQYLQSGAAPLRLNGNNAWPENLIHWWYLFKSRRGILRGNLERADKAREAMKKYIAPEVTHLSPPEVHLLALATRFWEAKSPFTNINTFWFWWLTLTDSRSQDERLVPRDSRLPPLPPNTSLLNLPALLEGRIACPQGSLRCYAVGRVLFLGTRDGPDKVTFAWCLSKFGKAPHLWSEEQFWEFDHNLIDLRSQLIKRLRVLEQCHQYFPLWRDIISEFISEKGIELQDAEISDLKPLMNKIVTVDFSYCSVETRTIIRHQPDGGAINDMARYLFGRCILDMHKTSKLDMTLLKLGLRHRSQPLSAVEDRLRIFALFSFSNEFKLPPKLDPSISRCFRKEDSENPGEYDFEGKWNYSKLLQVCLALSHGDCLMIKGSTLKRSKQHIRLPFRNLSYSHRDKLPAIDKPIPKPENASDYEEVRAHRGLTILQDMLRLIRKIFLLAIYHKQCSVALAAYLDHEEVVWPELIEPDELAMIYDRMISTLPQCDGGVSVVTLRGK